MTQHGTLVRGASRWRRAVPAMALMVVIATGCASDPTQSEEYRSLQASLDEAAKRIEQVEARLVGSEVALAEARGALGDANGLLAERDQRVAALEGAVEGMLFDIDGVHSYIGAYISGQLWLNEAAYRAAVDNAVSVDVADRLVAEFGLPGGDWAGYADDDNWWCWCQRVSAVGDPAATAAIDTWLAAEPGSEEEWWAFYEVQLILLGLLVDGVAEIEDRGVATLRRGDG